MPKIVCTYCPRPIDASNPHVPATHNGKPICPSCAVRLVLLNGVAA